MLEALVLGHAMRRNIWCNLLLLRLPLRLAGGALIALDSIVDRLRNLFVKLGLVALGHEWLSFVDACHLSHEALHSFEGTILRDLRQLLNHLFAELLQLIHCLHLDPLD